MAHLRCLIFALLAFAIASHASAALTAPATLSTASIKATSFTLKWTAATGATGGIAGYDVYQGGVMLGSTLPAARSFAVTGLAPTTTYSMTVVARDNSGHVSAPSAALAVTTPTDTAAPAKPTALASTALTTTSFTLGWTAPADNVGVTGYNVYRAAVLVGTSPTPSFALTALAPDTVHKMTVRAFDLAGNLSVSSVTLNVRTLADPPSVPTALTISNLKAASYTLTWSASTGGTGGIAGYDVWRDGVLAGTTTKKSFAFAVQTPLTTYSLTVAARDHEGRVSAPSAALSVSTPADTTKPTVPKDLSAGGVTHNAFTLTWTPSTDNVGVTGYDVLKNNVVIGSPTAASFAVTGLAPLTTYQMKVKAKDAAGNISGLSVVLPVTTAETPNVPPTVTLTSPPASSFFTLPAALTLAATAADSDGTVALVEFFDGAVKLGESPAPSTPPSTFTFPFTFTSPGPHSLFARATDNRHATVDSAHVPLCLLPGLPYVADFEVGEGYNPGSLHDQLGWTVATGAAQVTTLDSAHGEQGVRLEPGATVSFVDQEFGAGATNPSPVFVDVFVKPVAGATPGAGSLYDLDNARLAFVLNDTVGRFAVFDGDGSGAGTWKTLSADIAIDSTYAASAWLRLTVRLDYTAKTWDLYLDGRLLACDLKFRSNTATYLSGLSFQGHPTVASGLDELYAGADNPLFTDADHDGMDDAWETAHGLNPAVNDRNLDPDGDGLTNIQEYLLGTDPQKADTDGDGLTDGQERTLGTNPLVADTDGDGLPDGWEKSHGLNPLSDADAALDTDGDGKTNAEEYTAGTDPADYYNGARPVITVLAGGDGAPGPNGLLQVRVANATGDPLVNAPVVFTIATGSGQLAATGEAGALLANTITVRTTAEGTADVYYRTPTGQSTAASVTAQAGLAVATLGFTASNPSFPSALSIDFETSDGYAPGALGNQKGWTSFYESTVVEADATAPSGGNVLRLGAGSWLYHPVTPAVASGLVFVDFQAKVAAADYYSASSQFQPGGAFLSFARDSSGTAADVLAGNTGESFSYDITGTKVALDGNQTTAWHRYTLRLDYDRHRWDLYLDGKPIAADIYLAGQPLDTFYAQGANALPSWVDYIQVTGTHPLFTDADHDGMDDAWELAHGLDPTVNDRDLDPDHDGLTNIQEYVHGTDPHNADSDGDGLPDGWEVAHGLNPAFASDAVQDADGDGLFNLVEYKLGTDIHQAVTDSSGIPDAELDSDGDGISNLEEALHGTDPTDYYNGHTPVVTPLADYSQQLGPDGLFAVRVTDSAGNILVNAPIRFTTTPESRLTQNPYGSGSALTVLVRTGDDGVARVYVRPVGTEVP